MKKIQIIALSLLLAVGLIGCGTEKGADSTELSGSIIEQTTEDNKEGIAEQTTEKTEQVSSEEENPSPERVYGEECVGVITISINPEIDLEIDKAGNVLEVVFQNEDAKTAYEDLNLEGLEAKAAMKLIVETANEKGYLKDDGEVSLIYGSTGNASAEEAQEMINSARTSVMDTLNDLGKESTVSLEMKNYAQETSDICDLCYGVGTIVCEQCGGMGNGNGMVTCDLCMGTGTYDGEEEPPTDGLCRSCLGTGILTIQPQKCYICNGTGLCINCGGSGIDPEPDDFGNYGSCHACGGDGDCLQEVCEGGTMIERSETCRDCGGTGQDTGAFSGPSDEERGCYRCEGRGFMECNGCGGSLVENCYRCNGTGIKQP